MPSISHGAGKVYWRSLDELADTPEFRARLEREFPYLSSALASSSTRRHFLKLMGASLALAGLTGCRWPQEKIVEYARRPRGRVPGEPVQFATAIDRDGVATGYLVTSYDGRPIKVDGNPSHPFSQGATDALAQALILELYDPDRSSHPVDKAGKALPISAWSEFTSALGQLAADARAAQGDGLAILAPPSSSPTLADLRTRLAAAMPKAAWHEYSPLSRDNERAGLALAFGTPHRAHLSLSAAESIASFDCDFLLTHPASLRYTREFAGARTAPDRKTMSRLWVIESNLSLTGSNADQRYAERHAMVAVRLCQLAAALLRRGLVLPGAASSAGPAFAAVAERAQAPAYVEELAGELAARRGRCVIAVGPRQPAAAHAVAALLNTALGNAGATVSYFPEPDGPRESHVESIASLAERLGRGAVRSLLILGGNPAYDAPADLKFADALRGFGGVSIHASLYRDETSRLCSWHVPLAHDLEAWGDVRAWDGTLSIQQPLIEPLYGGKTAAELVAMLLRDEPVRAYDLVRRTHRSTFGAADFETAWRGALHDGVVAGSAWTPRAPAITLADWSTPLSALPAPGDAGDSSFEIAFAQDLKVYDGRFVNNAWLQELPDPITKLTWDNAALISVADARKLGVRRDDKIEIALGGATLTIPVCVVPGHAPGSITLPLGYGRAAAGRVAEGSGFDVNPLRTRSAFYAASGASVRVRGGTYGLATTQDHHAMATAVGDRESRRRIPELAREGTLAEYASTPGFAAQRGHSLPLVQMFGDHEHTFRKAQRWAMAIDLTRCTGCSACVIACQAENNIPVVGKHEVRLGREMHWMRVDRYFVSPADDLDNPQVIHQPVTCQHCENAPCEQVCPVAATVHDEQGLNVMVYNRCIGTRYCLNNCPYKVRRFNWFYNHHGPRHPRSREGGQSVFQTFDIKNTPSMLPQTQLTDIEKMAFNPDVTVRSRGVMEKCTFCVQRITRAKIHARNQRVTPRGGDHGPAEIPDGSVQTACQQACPAEAIVFGDLNVAGSRVGALHEHERSYVLLQELNVRPRNKYLAKLRNPLHDAGGGGGQHA